MSQQELEQQINKAVFQTISSLIPLYFLIAKSLLFLVGVVFAVVIVGVMLSGRVLLSALQLVSTISQVKHKAGVSA